MTTPSSEAARAEAERRYGSLMHVGDYGEYNAPNPEYDAFIAGAEWKGAQVEERATRLLRLAGCMLVAGAWAVDKAYPDDPSPIVQGDMRAFARWALDGAQGEPDVSEEALSYVEEMARTLQEEGDDGLAE